MACLFTQTTLDDEGFPVRDPGSSTYLATFEPAERFSRARGRRGPPPRLPSTSASTVIVGDGAVWIWNIADPAVRRRDPDRRSLPCPRARARARHASHSAAARQPARLARRPTGRARRRRHTALLNAGRDLRFTGSLARERDKALHYFETNAHRMRYSLTAPLGLFVGSGTVKAGCKSVIGQRLKLSGMRWNVPGATGIPTLRCHEASGRWEQIWPRPHNQTPLTSLDRYAS